MIPATTLIPEARQRAPAADRRGAFPVRAMAVSVLAHAVLIAIALKTHLQLPPPVLEPSVISMRLVPAPEAQQSPAPLEAVEQAPIDRVAEPAPATAPPSVAAPEPLPAEPHPDDPIPGDDFPEQTGTLRASLLDQVRPQPAEPGQATQNDLPWSSSGESVPGMPGVRGWISSYVGTVAPSAQTWKENDGSSRGRYVLANGTVVCTRRRAPTIDELMNPWKSTAVTMGSLCGRERPRAPDFSDPRIQPPPTAAGRSSTESRH